MNCLLYLLLPPLLTFLIHYFFYLRLPVYNTYKSLKVTQFTTKMKVWISLFIFNCFAGVNKTTEGENIKLVTSQTRAYYFRERKSILLLAGEVGKPSKFSRPKPKPYVTPHLPHNRAPLGDEVRYNLHDMS